LNCGYSEVSPTDIEDYIASHLVRRGILRAVKESNLESFVKEVIDLKLAETDDERLQVKGVVMRSGIEIVERNGWMRPCPNCQSNDTAVYRWKESGLLTKRFEPTY